MSGFSLNRTSVLQRKPTLLALRSRHSNGGLTVELRPRPVRADAPEANGYATPARPLVLVELYCDPINKVIKCDYFKVSIICRYLSLKWTPDLRQRFKLDTV